LIKGKNLRFKNQNTIWIVSLFFITVEVKMRAKNFIMAFAIFMLASNALQADVIPGRWEIVGSLESGTPITIRLKEGDRIECSLKNVGSEALKLIDSTGQVTTIPKSAVDQILGPAEEKDSNLNGTLWGLAIGGAGGTVLGAATRRTLDAGASAASYTAALGIIGAGIGALTGYVVDYSAQKSRPVIYRAPNE
jgi:hypothetical protein